MEDPIMKLAGQVAIVTGASRGIGRAIAQRCAQEGAKVALVARGADQLERAAAEIRDKGGTALAIPADVTDRTAAEAMARQAEATLGPVDLLVNNAGTFYAIGPTWEVDPETWWSDVTVNILGVFLCCRAVMPGMVARKKGRIINLIGGGADAPLPYGSAYATAKTAVMRFTETLAVEAKEHGVYVFALRPGFVRTTMSEYQLTEEGRRWLPHTAQRFEEDKDVPPNVPAELAVELASGRFDALTGRYLRVKDYKGEDPDQVEAQIPEILEKDLRTLRIR
jgi:NAD(P)-dependent dehydrogenase (short-subunit alcohol dehydrogenase family)